MSDDYSKDKLMDDMNETDPDWSKKNIRKRQVAHGATPSDEDDWSKNRLFLDGVGISPTTTTSTTTTSSTTASTSSTTTSTSPTLPFSLVVGDPPPPATGPWAQNWIPTPKPPHFDTVDDGTLDPPADVDYITAVGGAPVVEHLTIGAPSTPGGTYTTAVLTLRMQSANPADTVVVDMFDSSGAPLALPKAGPFIFANSGPGFENVQQPIPLVGPSGDPAITNGVIELVYTPGPAGPIDVTDIRIEWV